MTEIKLRFQRVLLNFISGITRSVVGIILGILATPIILRCFGEEQFGAFRVLLDLTAQLGILEFGLFSTLQVVFAKSIAHTNKWDVAGVSRLAHKKYFLVLLLQLISMTVIYFFSDRFIPVSSELESSIKISILIISINFLFCFSQIYKAFLDASQKGYIVSSLMMLQNIVFVFLSVIFAVRGFGIIGHSVALVISFSITFLILFLKTKKNLFKKSSQDIKSDIFASSIKEQRTPLFISHISGTLSLLVDNLIISFFLGAKTVTAFFLTQRLISIVGQQLQQIGNSTWPAMAELYFAKDQKHFNERLIVITQIIAFVSGVILAPLCFLNPPFVILWTGENTFAGNTLNILAIYNAGLWAITAFWQWCFAGTGLIKKALPMLVSQAVLNISISLLCTKYIGMIGPLLGTFIAFQFLTIPWQTYLIHKEFSAPILPLTKAWVLPFLIPVGGSIFLTQYIDYPVLESWSVFFLGSIALYLFCGTSFLFILLPKSTRTLIVDKLIDLLKKQSDA